MAQMQKLVCAWSGLTGGPAYSVFYARPGGGMQPFFKTFWTAIAGLIPSALSVTVPNSGDTVEESNGELQGVWTNGTSQTIAGTSSSAFAPQVGGLIQWRTGQMRRGHRIQGHTFVVPIGGANFTAAGILVTTAQSTLASAANTLWSSGGGSMLVWHRPLMNYTPNPPEQLLPGEGIPINASNVPFKIATLNSRRDT